MSIFSSSHPDSSRRRLSDSHHARRLPAHSGTEGRRARSSSTETDAATEGAFASALLAALFALPVMALIGFLLLLIVTAVAYTNADPDSLTAPLALGILGLSALLGGFIAARRGRNRPLLCGLLFGLLFMLLLLTISLFFDSEAKAQLSLGLPSVAVWGLRMATVLFSVLGGKIGGHRPTKVTAHKHRVKQ